MSVILTVVVALVLVTVYLLVFLPMDDHDREEMVDLRNEEDLEVLKRELGDYKVTIFGSSVRDGDFAPFFGRYHDGTDIDLMIEVDDETFCRWAKKVYLSGEIGQGDEHVGWSQVGHRFEYQGEVYHIPYYGSVSPTQRPRLRAAEEVLGVKLATRARVDVFLFPKSFIEGSMVIPAWDDPERSFKKEVMAGKPLTSLEARIIKERVPKYRHTKTVKNGATVERWTRV